MVKIINGVLTSPVNAGSLERGDVVIHNGRKRRPDWLQLIGQL